MQLMHVLRITQSRCRPLCVYKRESRCRPLCAMRGKDALHIQETICGKCRKMEKCNKEKICKSCNTKRSICSQMFGKWPVECFTKLDEDQQLAFWLDTDRSKNGIFVSLEKQVIDCRMKTTKHIRGGKYLPLSVYEKDGFDVEHIKARCLDTEEHDVLGTTYRVSIHELCIEDIQQEVHRDMVKMMHGSKKRSRSSSSASDDKKKKKEKKKKRKSHLPVLRLGRASLVARHPAKRVRR